MAHVLVAGSGYIGSALGIRLAAEGHVVWGLRRDPKALPAVVHGVEADLRVPNTLRRLPRVDQVFYMPSAPAGDGDARRGLWLDGARYLLGALAAARQRVRRFFYVSGLEVYAQTGGDWVDEDSEAAATSPDGTLRREAERVAQDAPFPTTVLRLGEVYGPSRLGPLDAVLRGELDAKGPPTAHANLIHRDDCVGAMAHLAGRRRIEDTYLLVDREPTPRIEILAWLAERLGRSLPTLDGTQPIDVGAPDVRAMSERLVEGGFAFRYRSYREGFGPLLSRLGRTS